MSTIFPTHARSFCLQFGGGCFVVFCFVITFAIKIRAFHGAIHMNTVKVFHEGRPVLYGWKWS